MFKAKKSEMNFNWRRIQDDSNDEIFPTYKIVPLKGYKLGGNKEMGKEKKS